MSTPEVLDQLDRLITESRSEGLPALLGRLVELEELARLRLRSSASAPPSLRDEADVWITPEAAAVIAGLPTAASGDTRRSIRRIYEWARGQRWASRPSRKCLRISERGFRRWLATRA